MKYIKANDLPDIAARKAYETGHYIEAIQIMHGFIENQAQALLMLIGCVHFNSIQENTWNLTDEIKLSTVLKILYILNQITKEEYDRFKNLNTLRNKVVHQLYKEPYDKIDYGVSIDEYDKVFNLMLEDIYFFTEKAEIIID